ncbi:SDR family NAD(P)-dependent oxidoreductase [Microbacterium sp. F51-2R]|uniref:SDR family NAD(P)-dependent oxidoreductase n=1 Tax=Microbacterium sp. F51-2R TaxID=3445777 RepID=UPI003FA133FE
MNMQLLGSKTALVTGAAGGIGSVVAKTFAAQGATVVLTDRKGADLRSVEADILAAGGRASSIEIDVTEWDDIASAVERIRADVGHVHVLANVAGGSTGSGGSQPIEALDTHEWDRSLTLNLSSAFYMSKALHPLIRAAGGGAIVNVASLAAIRMSTHGGAAYTAAKSGILGLTRHSAFEFARDEVRVNAVLPGIVDGPAMRIANPEATKQAEATIPLGRMTTQQEIANAMLFLASDLASGITGEYLLVDGGMQIGSPTSSSVYFEARAAAGR